MQKTQKQRHSDISSLGRTVGTTSSNADPANDSQEESVQVAIRVRPMNARERGLGGKSAVSMRRRCVNLDGEESAFPCDVALWSVAGSNDADGNPPVGQEDVYKLIGLPLLDHALQGFNTCLLAYGQTGSGKTYTMMGNIGDNDTLEGGTEGIIPRLCNDLFHRIQEKEREVSEEMFSWSVEASYVEIYCEAVTDLLDANTSVAIRQEKSRFTLTGAKRQPVRTTAGILKLLQVGNANRRTAATKMNDRSSRSHAVLILDLKETLHIKLPDGQTAAAPSKTLSIKLVDLAGSERTSESGATGERMREANAINKSLFTLGRVIEILSDKKKLLPPYHDSALTKLLKDSFGGNSKTTLIATISPCEAYRSQTASTLQYAARARRIVNIPIVLEDPQAKELRRKQQELDEVRRELEEARRTGGGGEAAQQLEQQLREAQDRIRKDEAERQQREEELARREEELARLVHDNESAQASWKEQLAAIEKAKGDAQADAERKQQELAAAQKEFDVLTLRVQNDMKAQQDAIDSLQQETEQRRQEMEEALAQKEAEVMQLKKRTEDALQTASADVERREREVSETCKKREMELAERVRVCDSHVAAVEAEVSTRIAQAEEAARKKEEVLAARLKAAAESTVRASQREKELARRVQEAENAAKSKEAEVQAKQQCLDAALVKATAREEDLRETMLAAQAAVEQKEQTCQAALIAIKDAEVQSKQLAALLTERETESLKTEETIKELAKKMAAMESREEQLQRKAESQKRAFAQREKDLQRKETELQQAMAATQTVKDERNNLMVQARDLRDGILSVNEKLEEENRSLREQLQVFRSGKNPCPRCTFGNSLVAQACTACGSPIVPLAKAAAKPAEGHKANVSREGLSSSVHSGSHAESSPSVTRGTAANNRTPNR